MSGPERALDLATASDRLDRAVADLRARPSSLAILHLHDAVAAHVRAWEAHHGRPADPDIRSLRQARRQGGSA